MKRFLFVLIFCFLAGSAQATEVFNDGFTEASTIVLSSHTPDTTGTSWTKLTDDTSQTVNNYSADYAGISGAVTAGQKEIWSADYTTVGADVDITADIYINTTDDTNAACMFVRYADASNYYVAVITRGATRGVELYKVISGTATSLGSGTAQAAITGTIKLSAVGSAIKITVDAVDQVSITDSSITAAGKSGISFGDCALLGTDAIINTTRFDNLIVNETAAAGGSTVPNQIY